MQLLPCNEKFLVGASHSRNARNRMTKDEECEQKKRLVLRRRWNLLRQHKSDARKYEAPKKTSTPQVIFIREFSTVSISIYRSRIRGSRSNQTEVERPECSILTRVLVSSQCSEKYSDAALPGNRMLLPGSNTRLKKRNLELKVAVRS